MTLPVISEGEFVRRSFLASILLSCALAVSQPSSYAQVKREKSKPPVAAQGKQDKTKPAATPAPQEKRETAKTAATPERFGNVEAITAAQLKEWLYVVASDEMEGRDTPSRGLDMTAKFIADHLSQWGVKPGGDDGTYFQKFALTSRRVEPELTIASVNGQSFKLGEGFIAQPIDAKLLAESSPILSEPVAPEAGGAAAERRKNSRHLRLRKDGQSDPRRREARLRGDQEAGEPGRAGRGFRPRRRQTGQLQRQREG